MPAGHALDISRFPRTASGALALPWEGVTIAGIRFVGNLGAGMWGGELMVSVDLPTTNDLEAYAVLLGLLRSDAWAVVHHPSLSVLYASERFVFCSATDLLCVARSLGRGPAKASLWFDSPEMAARRPKKPESRPAHLEPAQWAWNTR